MIDNSNKNSIVIVDIDSAQIVKLVDILKDYRFDVEHFTDSQKAFNFCLENQPNLVITELSGPEINGMELFRKIKDNPLIRDIPIILLTKEVELDERLKSMEMEIDDYIYKPFLEEEVAARIDTIVQEMEVIHQIHKMSEHGFTGNLAEMNLVDLIQTLELGQKSGIIRLNRKDEEGIVYIDKGNVIDATIEDIEPERALTNMLTWLEGKFQVSLEPIEREHLIKKTNRDILLKGTQLIQEWRDLAGRMPTLDTILKAVAHNIHATLSPEEKKILPLFNNPTSILKGIETSKLDNLKALLIINSLLEKHLLTIEPSAKESGHYNQAIIDRIKNEREKNESIYSRIASFFKRKTNTQLNDFEQDNNNNGVNSEEHLVLNYHAKQQKPKIPHKIYLNKGELLLIRQKLLSN